jgi:hypothetical protein
MNKIFIKKILGLSLKTVFIFSIFFIGIIFVEYQKQRKDFDSRFKQNISLYQNIPQEKTIKILGEETENEKMAQGRQYAIGNINIAGETLASMNEDEKEKEIEISNIQGRVYKDEEDENINYLTSWQSNKPTVSSVEYIKEGSKEIQIIEEDAYNYVHNIVFPQIDFSSVYKYVIKSKDRWGNEVQTGQFVFYTGPEEASFFQLLENALTESFGWMSNK